MPLYKPAPGSPPYGTRIDGQVWTTPAPGCHFRGWGYPTMSDNPRYTLVNDLVLAFAGKWFDLSPLERTAWGAAAWAWPWLGAWALLCHPGGGGGPFTGEDLHRVVSVARWFQGMQYVTACPTPITYPDADLLTLTCKGPPPTPPPPLLCNLWLLWTRGPGSLSPANRILIWVGRKGPSYSLPTSMRSATWGAQGTLQKNQEGRYNTQVLKANVVTGPGPYRLTAWICETGLSPFYGIVLPFQNTPV